MIVINSKIKTDIKGDGIREFSPLSLQLEDIYLCHLLEFK